MALEQIIAALEQEAAAQVEAMRAEAASEEVRLRQESEAACADIRTRALEAIQPRLLAEQSRRLNQARLEAQRDRLNVQHALVAEVFEAARSELAHARARPDYAELLAALADEAIAALGSPLVLEVDARDAGLVASIASGRPVQVEVAPVLECCGGLAGRSPDGRVRVDNTLETRLAQAQERYRSAVAALLDEAGQDVS